MDRKTALAVLQDISHAMYPSHDIFGNGTLVIDRYEFEVIRHKYLDSKCEKEECNDTREKL